MYTTFLTTFHIPKISDLLFIFTDRCTASSDLFIFSADADLLIPHYSVSQLFAAFTLSTPPPHTKPAFADALFAVYAEAKLPNEAAECTAWLEATVVSLRYRLSTCFLSSGEFDQFDTTLKIFASGAWVDKFSYGKAIQSAPAVKSGESGKGFELMNAMKHRGIRPNGFVYNVLIDGLCKEKRVGDAQKLFDEMSKRNVAPNRVTYNILIDGYCK